MRGGAAVAAPQKEVRHAVVRPRAPGVDLQRECLAQVVEALRLKVAIRFAAEEAAPPGHANALGGTCRVAGGPASAAIGPPQATCKNHTEQPRTRLLRGARSVVRG